MRWQPSQRRPGQPFPDNYVPLPEQVHKHLRKLQPGTSLSRASHAMMHAQALSNPLMPWCMHRLSAH